MTKLDLGKLNAIAGDDFSKDAISQASVEVQEILSDEVASAKRQLAADVAADASDSLSGVLAGLGEGPKQRVFDQNQEHYAAELDRGNPEAQQNAEVASAVKDALSGLDQPLFDESTRSSLAALTRGGTDAVASDSKIDSQVDSDSISIRDIKQSQTRVTSLDDI